MIEKVSTGCKVLDKLLSGGFEKDIISTIFGPAGTGKSNIAMLISLRVAAQGKKVVFVDTEGGFSTERIEQMAPSDHKALLKNIILLNPTSFEEQKKYFEQLAELVDAKKIGLIVVDSIAMLYRLQKGSTEEIAVTNQEMAAQLSILSKIARRKHIAIVATNQVYSDFGNPNSFHMVGGDLLKYWSKCIIKLEKVDGIRKASIYKHRNLPDTASVFFEITQHGLEEAKEPKKKFSLF